MKWTVLLVVCVLAGAGTGVRWAGAQDTETDTADTLSVASAAFCTGIEDREPVGSAVTFSPDVDRIYLWTEIGASRTPSSITHVWYYEQNKMLDVPLDINYPRTRTWSYKTIVPDWVGDWHVDIVDGDGTVLKRVSFTIGGEQEP